MTNLNLLAANTSTTNSTWASAVPKSIKTTADAANAALTATTGQASMGQKDFLKLFTTQLNNQDPLDPVKNEAFVAQLAQFSQLEATTGMAQTLTDYVSSMSGERMMASANLIGKKVSVTDGPAVLSGGAPVFGTVALPSGADGVSFQIYDSKGTQVATKTIGPQTAGDMPWAWDGPNDAGTALPDGVYRISASAVSQGKNFTPSVKTMVTVVGVNQAADKSMLLQVQGGKTVNLADITTISG
ncbi:MAG: flagellar hook assembly protein FlgD [Rhodoferax sp.]